MFDVEQLDSILGLQVTVAWAGEKAAEPQRLGWWDTDVIDEGAGGDLWKRLLPKTRAWAGLELAREAAIRVDRAARAKRSDADRIWTLFHLGFELDEQLRDRLAHHKRHQSVPSEALAASWGVGASWDRKAFEAFLTKLGKAAAEETPAGRKLKSAAGKPAQRVRALGAALLPLGAAYPMPFVDAPAAP